MARRMPFKAEELEKLTEYVVQNQNTTEIGGDAEIDGNLQVNGSIDTDVDIYANSITIANDVFAKVIANITEIYAPYMLDNTILLTDYTTSVADLVFTYESQLGKGLYLINLSAGTQNNFVGIVAILLDGTSRVFGNIGITGGDIISYDLLNDEDNGVTLTIIDGIGISGTPKSISLIELISFNEY